MQNKYQASPSYTQELEYSISEAKSKGSTLKDLRYSTLKGNTEYEDSNIKEKVKTISEKDERPIDPTVYKDAIKSLRDELSRLRGGPANQVINDTNQNITSKTDQRTSGKSENQRERESENRVAYDEEEISKKEIDVAEKIKIQNNQNQREKIISPKIYKSPNEKDEIDKSYHNENNSRSSVKSYESRPRNSERPLQNIPSKIAEIERELDEQINQVDEYLVNKKLIEKNFAKSSDDEFEDTSAKKSKSNSDALDSQKKHFKDAFEKNQKRLQEEESKIENSKTLKKEPNWKYTKSSERKIEDENDVEEENENIPKEKDPRELFFETQLNRLRAENDKLNYELEQLSKGKRNIDFRKSSKVWRNQEQDFESAEDMAQYRNTMNAKSEIATLHSQKDREIREVAERARSQLRKKLEQNESKIHHKIDSDSFKNFKLNQSCPKTTNKRLQKETNFLLSKGIPTKYSSDRSINNLIWRNIN